MGFWKDNRMRNIINIEQNKEKQTTCHFNKQVVGVQWANTRTSHKHISCSLDWFEAMIQEETHNILP
jgi:hypothetical protein